MRTIVTYPNEILRIKTKPIVEITGEIQAKANELAKMLTDCGNGVGLAAPQIGMTERMFAIKRNGKVEVIMNPEVVKTWGEKEFPVIADPRPTAAKALAGKEEEFLEGCLSFPNLFGTVRRYLKIEARWINGGQILEGFNAIVFQHELDHLNGVLVIDRIRESKGRIYRILGEKKVEIELPR